MITLPGSALLPQVAGGTGTPTDVTGIVTLNVQNAAAGRAHRQIDWLAGLDVADVVVLTEVPARGTAHVQSLSDHGYSTASSPPGEDYRVIVATRVGDISLVPFFTGSLAHRVVSARIDLRDGRHVGVVGLYVPSRGPQARRNIDKRAFQIDITAALSNLATAFGPIPILAAGDLNVVEPGHQPHHQVFGRWEYDFYTSFTTNGLTDAFRHHQPDAVDHSWFGRSGQGYRFDHLFVTTPQLDMVTDCHYLHDPRRLGLTDHSALAATLTLAH
jgi:exonuclease III